MAYPIQGSSPYLQGSNPQLQKTIPVNTLQPAKPLKPIQGSQPSLQSVPVMPPAAPQAQIQAMEPQTYNFMNESFTGTGNTNTGGGVSNVGVAKPIQNPTSQNTSPNPQTEAGLNSLNTADTTPATMPIPQLPPQAPDNQIKALREKYLATFAPSEDITKTQGDITNLEGSLALGKQAIQDKPIPLSFVRGLQAKLDTQGQLQEQTLQEKLANLLSQRGLTQKQAETELGFAQSDQERQDALDKDKREANAPFELSPGQARYALNPISGKYEQVASVAAKPDLPASAQEYEYAVAQGYKGTYEQYQDQDSNRKAKAGGAGLLGGLTASQINSTVNQIAGNFDNEGIVKNFNVLNEANQFVKSLSNTTTNPVDDQGLIYALAKSLDPSSAVREGEYATAQKYAQSLIQSYGKSVEQALNGTGFLSTDARANIKKTIEAKYNASLQNYNNVYQQYQQRIDAAKSGQGNTLTNYNQAYSSTGSTPDYGAKYGF